MKKISEKVPLIENNEFEIRKELEAAINACQEGIYICDSELKCIRVNRAYERITGIPGTRLFGKTSKQLEKEGVITKGVAPIVREKKQEVSLIQIFPTTGKKVLVTGKPVYHDDSLFRIVITARDLTELNNLETRLKDLEEKNQQYFNELNELKQQHSTQIITESSVMTNIIEMIPRIAAVDSPILIQGESGTGKEVVSKLIHESSNRAQHPFIKINCGAIPETLLESELFGYVKGAFTGADVKGKLGLFELADKGTLFLDEIGEMPLTLQVKLLRVLQDFEVTRLGSTIPRKVNVRIICATNRSFDDMIKIGEFREDLFYRINVIPIFIPPLRERTRDIQPLIQQALERLKTKYNSNKRLSIEALELMEQYHWPGNIRELQNVIERLFIMTPEDIIETIHIPSYIQSFDHYFSKDQDLTLKEKVEDYEKKLLLDAIDETKNFRQAAKKLGINPSTLTRKLQKYTK